LLGRTAAGGWRHAPFRAVDPGQGQDPSLEPRVEVIRRLIAYPATSFAALIQAIARSDRDPRHPIQWVCHRSPGEAPARPYWLTFLRAREHQGRRFYVGLELFDRDRIGLWFFSGYRDQSVPRAAKAPFPDKPTVALPRFEITDEFLRQRPFERWVQLAFHDALLSFDLAEDQATAAEGPGAPGGADPLQAPMPSPSQGPLGLEDRSLVLDSAAAQALAAERVDRLVKSVGPAAPSVPFNPEETASIPKTFVVEKPSTGSMPTLDPVEAVERLELRSARARLVIAVPGRPAMAVPLARLVTVLGRDPRCDLVIDERSVSGEHAKIVFREGTPTLEDLGSKNGTRLGAAVVKRSDAPAVLPDEAFLALGSVACLFVRDAEETLPPGEKRPERHRAKVEEFVARGRIPRATADRAFMEARLRGLTPGEVLIINGAITPLEWTGVKPASTGGGCVVLFFLLVLLGALAGCHSMAIPPFYEQSIDEHVPMREGEREVTWEDDVGLRPLFQVRTDEKDDRTEVHWLFPLGTYERKGEDKRVHVYPFYLRDVRVDPDGFKHDTTVMFPPGVFAGSHPVHGDFAYVFPFGGNMYGLFGKDEIIGVLFPLYAWTRDRGVETNHILFPLIAWWSGGDEKATESGWRVLPFYGHQEKVSAEGVQIFDRHTVLWPFITWVHEAKNARNPYDSIFIFPFWGKTRSDWRDEDTVLWPLFRYYHDKQEHYQEWRAPFPFFFFGTDDGSEGAAANSRFDIWPLFGFRNRNDSYTRHFFLWPFERYERQETDEYIDKRFWFVPFLYTMSRVGKTPPSSAGPSDAVAAASAEPPWTERKTRLWPLLKYHRTKEGDVELHALELMLWDDPMLNFDTILDPLYRLFRYVSKHDGSSELDVLLGIFSSRTKADGSSRWDVLGGLFGHGTDSKGEGTMRLLWFLDI
jgi:hypothetical protein